MNSTLTGLFIINLPLADVLSAFRMSDFAGKMIVLVLFVGSIFAWSVMVTKFMELRRVEQNAEQFSALYRKSRWPLELFAQQPPPSNNPLSALIMPSAATWRAPCKLHPR